MNKNIKIIIGIFGVAVVGVGGYYLYLKNKTEKDVKTLSDAINKTPINTSQPTKSSSTSSPSDFLLDVNDIGVQPISNNTDTGVPSLPPKSSAEKVAYYTLGKNIVQAYVILNGKKRPITAFEMAKYLDKRNEWVEMSLLTLNQIPNF